MLIILGLVVIFVADGRAESGPYFGGNKAGLPVRTSWMMWLSSVVETGLLLLSNFREAKLPIFLVGQNMILPGPDWLPERIIWSW